MNYKSTIKINNKNLDLSKPVLMGILNFTPDSFYDGGKFDKISSAIAHCCKMAEQGASIIDIGAVSTRPFAGEITAETEWQRLSDLLTKLRNTLPEIIISVDTYRASVAEKAANSGADIINDIAGGQSDQAMFATITRLQIPYIMMHMQGTPQTMQQNPQYENVVEEVLSFFRQNIKRLKQMGHNAPIIIDPGFGFGKTVEHNYQLLKSLDRLKELNCPVLTGVSRKSMINKVLGTTPDRALNGTTVINTIALLKGADILRVHDVAEAAEVVKLVQIFQNTRKP